MFERFLGQKVVIKSVNGIKLIGVLTDISRESYELDNGNIKFPAYELAIMRIARSIDEAEIINPGNMVVGKQGHKGFPTDSEMAFNAKQVQVLEKKGTQADNLRNINKK